MCRKSSEDSPATKDNSNVSLGLDFEQRWQIIQHFTEWIKHGDSKIQMLLTVQGVVVAAYGAYISSFLSKQNAWNSCTIFFNIIFAVVTLGSFAFGFFGALQPYTKQHAGEEEKRNVFFYGSYKKDGCLPELEILDDEEQLKQLSRQISILGDTAKIKFKNVKILQGLVVASIILLTPVIISFSFVK